MVPKDGSSLKETNTAHGVRRVEERKRKLREGERRRAGRREAKPRESVANQALRPPPFLHPTLRPTPRDSPPPLHVSAPRHPPIFPASRTGWGHVNRLSLPWRVDHNPNPKGVHVFSLFYIGNVLHAQRELLLPSSSACMKGCGIF